MKGPLKYQLIAAFLLLVFSLNTLAGFACSVGIDMGYNKHHHEHSLVHPGGVNMCHATSMHQAGVSAAAGDRDCCSGVVTQFNQLDKTVTAPHAELQAPVFLLAFFITSLFKSVGDNSTSKESRFAYLRRSCFLNHTTIRIAIQSFQI